MVCPNCAGNDTATTDTTNNNNSATNGKAKTQPPTKTLNCNHGPNAACPNCRPAVPEEQDNSTQRIRCRNHGPNGSCVECLERLDRKKMRLKLQDAAHCSQVLVDYQAANVFQNYLHEQKYRVQRCGYLYGTYNDDGTTTVEVIYEPPQKSEKDKAVLLPNPNEERVDTIASLLGLRRVCKLKVTH